MYQVFSPCPELCLRYPTIATYSMTNAQRKTLCLPRNYSTSPLYLKTCPLFSSVPALAAVAPGNRARSRPDSGGDQSPRIPPNGLPCAWKIPQPHLHIHYLASLNCLARLADPIRVLPPRSAPLPPPVQISTCLEPPEQPLPWRVYRRVLEGTCQA